MPEPTSVLNVGDIAEIFAKLPPGTPVALDDGFEYRALLHAADEVMAFVDEDDIEHDVTCLVLTSSQTGQALDASLSAHHQRSERRGDQPADDAVRQTYPTQATHVGTPHVTIGDLARALADIDAGIRITLGMNEKDWPVNTTELVEMLTRETA